MSVNVQIKKRQRRRVEKVYGDVIASSSLKRKDFKHEGDRRFRIKATHSVTFVVERGKDRQEWRAKNAEGVTGI